MITTESIQLGIIIVNYKSYRKTTDYIKNELLKINISKKVVVVTNDFDDSEVVLMAKQFHSCIVESSEILNLNAEVFFINTSKNLGFAKANNIGAKFLVKFFNPQYLLFSNNDIVILSNNICEQLISKLESKTNYAVIGPAIISKDENGKEVDGSPNPQFVSAFRFLHRHLLYPIHCLLKMFKSQNINTSDKIIFSEGERYWVSGCFMLAQTNKFVQAEMFDENTFLYAEEVILSERLKKIGFVNYYYPSVKVFHEENATTSRYFDNHKKSKLVFDSLTYYYTTYIVNKTIWLPLFKFTKFIFFNIYLHPSLKKKRTI